MQQFQSQRGHLAGQELGSDHRIKLRINSVLITLSTWKKTQTPYISRHPIGLGVRTPFSVGFLTKWLLQNKTITIGKPINQLLYPNSHILIFVLLVKLFSSVLKLDF
jgi:hypothetical protein